MKVLFVCEGNQMRSPMAEAFYNSFTKSSDAQSAGADPYPLGKSINEVAEIMYEKGVILHHGSQLVTQKMIDEADVVVAFPTPLMPSFVLESEKTIKWDVKDPYYQPDDGTDYLRQARDSIEIKVRKMVDEAIKS